MIGVSTRTPPNTAPFSDFHYGPPAVPLFTKTRTDRREVAAPPAPAPIPVPQYPQVIYLPQPDTYRHQRVHRNTDSSSSEVVSRDKRSSSPFLQAGREPLPFPTVEDWLGSIQTKDGAEMRDFPAMSDKFDAHLFLAMGIDDLARLPHEAFGKNGFDFVLAEVSFLRKWLDIRMAELRPKSSRREAKRARH